MIRAVLDTNVLIAAIINVKSSLTQEIYQKFLTLHFTLIISPDVLEEVEDLINRERIVGRHKRTTNEREVIMSEIASLSYIVPGTTQVEVVRDPNDNKIISAALEGKAEYIVSRDKDLLDLNEYQGIKIITPEKFIEILRVKILTKN